MPAPDYVFTIFAFVSFFLCLIKFSMQWHAWNIGVHLYLGWVGLLCLPLGINSIIWKNNTVNWAPVWCDITSRLIIGIFVALPASILSINRRLYSLASPSSVLHFQADKRREIMIDLGIGIGLPVIAIVLAFFAQASRFMILEDYGCYPSVFGSWVGIILVNVPPMLLELIAGVYGCLAIHAFRKRRSQMNKILSGHSNLNSNRYLRLMCFSAGDLLTGLAVTIACLFFSIAPGLQAFPGLTQEHSHFSEIIQVPAVVWRSTTISSWRWELNRWIIVWSALIFFAIFGFTADARNNYRAALQAVIQVFITTTGIKSTASEAEEITFKDTSRELPVSVDTVNSA